jgi:spermidine/putrescine transport system permease protein
MDSWKDNRLVFWIWGTPPTLWLVIFFLAPLGIIWGLSFAEKTSILDTEITGTLDNYMRALGDPIYLGIIWKSVWISVIATALCLLIAYPLAFLISFASARWKTFLLIAVILPFWINLLIRTYALITVFRTRGIINNSLEWVYTNLRLDHLFGQFEPLEMLYNNNAVLAGLVYVFMPFMVLPLYASIERLDKSYLEASLDLGASQFRTFLSVTIPLTMPGIVSGIILVFIPMLGSFLVPDLLGGTNAQMIGNVIERQFKAANDWPFGSALSFLLMYATFGALALRAYLAGRKSGMGI